MLFKVYLVKLEHMLTGFLKKAQSIDQELSDYVEHIGETEFQFKGDNPYDHSAYNHVHLRGLQVLARDNPRVTLEVQVQAVEYIFERWKTRLKSFHPYTQKGYRLELSENFAPTISVEANTVYGRTGGNSAVYVDSMLEIFRIYEGQDWCSFLQPSEKSAILYAVEQSQGSIGTRAAQLIGLNAVELRKYIEWFEMDDEVNTIRKQFHRRPVQFLSYEQRFSKYKIYEICLPAHYK
jgi:hypothetical protein